jgi:hypothetical protein
LHCQLLLLLLLLALLARPVTHAPAAAAASSAAAAELPLAAAGPWPCLQAWPVCFEGQDCRCLQEQQPLPSLLLLLPLVLAGALGSPCWWWGQWQECRQQQLLQHHHC